MNQRHKHADVIHAWAEGEEVEVMFTPSEGWVDTSKPKWHEDVDYRIKPKRVKKEGWVNAYEYGVLGFKAYQTEEEADTQKCSRDRIACVRIEWEEEE